MDVLRESMQRQGITIEIELPPELPSVRGGQEDVERVLLNLATNAREAMPRGGVLRVAVDQPDEWIRLRLEDTGRGIPAEIIKQIDTPFFTTKPEGWGLGLPTCRSIVSEIGGEMLIESVLERGTSVTVKLRPALTAAD
jgi:signal transduction histidine kinase